MINKLHQIFPIGISIAFVINIRRIFSILKAGRKVGIDIIRSEHPTLHLIGKL